MPLGNRNASTIFSARACLSLTSSSLVNGQASLTAASQRDFSHLFLGPDLEVGGIKTEDFRHDSCGSTLVSPDAAIN